MLYCKYWALESSSFSVFSGVRLLCGVKQGCVIDRRDGLKAINLLQVLVFLVGKRFKM